MYDDIRKKIEHYCAYQERCHEEVRSKLIQLKCRYEEVDEYIAHLIEHNFLSEMRYAEQYVMGKFRLKKWGKNKIVNNLRMKKISDYCISKALRQIDDADYDQVVSELLEKKNREIKDNNPFTRKRKLYSFLLQKGYEPDIIQSHISG